MLKPPLIIASLLASFAIQIPIAIVTVAPADYGLHEGDAISASGSSDPDVYIVNAWGYKRLFVNPAIFNLYGNLIGWAKVKAVSAATRDAFVTSGLFRNCETGDQKVYGLEVVSEDVANLRWVNTSGAQAVADDANFFKKVFCINTAEQNLYGRGTDYTSVLQVPTYSPKIAAIPSPIITPVPTPTPAPPLSAGVHRLSDAAKEGYVSITHAYSSVNPFNSNSTLVLLEKAGGVDHVRDLKGTIVRDNLNQFGILPTGEPIWSRTDPNVIYYHTAEGNELRSYNVTTNTMTVLHVFKEYTAIDFSLGEGDLSEDSDHLTILGDKRYGFIYTLSTQHSSPVADFNQYGSVDSFDITPSNNAVLITSEPGGIYYFDEQMSLVKKEGSFDGHSDRARDTDGSDILVMANAADPTPLPGCPNGVIKITLGTGAQKCLASFDWRLALHVSCNNIGQDWCLISTYLPMSTMTPPPMSDAMVKVYLDGTPPVSITDTGSSNTSYTRTPRAAVDHSGQYLLFDSDMKQRSVDSYLVTLLR